jgi:glutathione S-transferase
MLEVWGRRNSSNVMSVMWAIGELGLAHRRHDVGGSFGGLDTPAYLAMNPNARVPTIDDDGFVLWESNAIVRYLARRHGAGGLLPDGEAGYAIADQWMDWCKTSVYPQFIDLFMALVRTEPENRDPGRIADGAGRLGASLAILDAHLAERAYIAGDRLTMADIPYGPVAYRYFNLEIERPALPHVGAWYARLCERPAYRAHVMIPFGRDLAEWTRLEREGAA